MDDAFKFHTNAIIDAADKYGVVNLKLEEEVPFVEITTISLDNVMDHLLYVKRLDVDARLHFPVFDRIFLFGQIQ